MNKLYHITAFGVTASGLNEAQPSGIFVGQADSVGNILKQYLKSYRWYRTCYKLSEEGQAEIYEVVYDLDGEIIKYRLYIVECDPTKLTWIDVFGVTRGVWASVREI